MPADQSNGMATLVGPDADHDQNGFPNTVQRKTSDCPCCLFFVICLCVVGFLEHQVDNKGNISRFEGLTDYNGKFCGLSESVVDKPFLYFCKDELEDDTADPDRRRDRGCVKDCADPHLVVCPGGEKMVPYDTVPYANILCLPTDHREMEIVRTQFLADPNVSMFLVGVAFSRAWPAIFLSVIIAITTAFVYLIAISRCSKVLIYIGLGWIVGGGMIFGMFLLYLSRTGGADGIKGSGDEMVSFMAGILTILASFVVMGVALTFSKNLTASLACIKAGAECIWDSPSIVFEPFLHLSLKLTILIFAAVGFLRLLTWMDQDVTTYINEVSIRVKLHYNVGNWACMLFYLFMCAWILEINNCLSDFATSFAAQQWFFAPYDSALNSKEAPAFSTCQGYAVALRYHMATIVYGALCNVVFRVPRMIFGGLHYIRNDETNVLSSCLEKCGACLSNPYVNFLKYMSPNAFMDVALNGSGFMKAAFFTVTTLESEMTVFFQHHGSAWLVQFIGHCFVSALGGISTYLMCRQGYFLGGPHMADYTSADYVPRPSIMGFIAALICWAAAHPFLTLAGHVSENLLFCFAIEHRRLHNSLVKGVVESASMLTRFTPCIGRSPTEQHHMGSTVAQPPAVKKLLEEANHDMSWF